MPLDYVLGSPVSQKNGGLILHLAESVTRCVAFIAVQNPDTGEFSYGGTGFFVGYVDEDGHYGSYFVTAKHIAENVQGSDFLMRIGSTKLLVCEARWATLKSDLSVDVAVTPYYPPADAGAERFPGEHFLTKDKMGSKRIGFGDQVYVAGFYRLHPGEGKNRPIVHTGHIAMMPDSEERFSVRNWLGPVEGYLVEAQTLSGLSGSPAFVRRSIMVQKTEESGTPPLAYGAVFLLGLWMASYDGIPSEELAKEPQVAARQLKHQPIEAPVGTGIVVPAYKIMELLNSPELKNERRARHEGVT